MRTLLFPRLVEEFRLFVPDSCTQGGELPCHLTWRGTAIKGVRVSLSRGIALQEVYNSGEAHGGDEYLFDSFDIPGYLGMVFSVGIHEHPRDEIRIRFEIEDSGGMVEVHNKAVTTFRPLVEARAKNVRPEKSLKGVVAIKNNGYGTPIIKLDISEEGGVHLEKPPGLKEFQEGFKRDLRIRIPGLIQSHPNQEKLLTMLVDMTSTDLDFTDEKRMNEVREYFEDLSDAMTEDEKFESDLIDAVGGAFMNNVKGSTYFEKALEYLQSLPGDHFILVNPLDNIVIPKGSHQIKFIIRNTDRSYNKYPNIDLVPIQFESQKTVRVPVYKLIDVEVK